MTPWRWLLALALVVGAALRLIGLGSLPPGLHPDEAADAFEAWTLARTGHASDGRSLPLVFDHHGVDWVEGTYVWLETPFVAAAGGSLEIEVAARLPAALAGIGAVLATFFLARRLGGERLGALAAAIFAVEPWAWHHARFGERAALEPVLVASGLALALRGLDRLDIRGSARAAVLGGSLLGLAAVNYPPARVVLPLVVLGLIWASDAPRARKLAVVGTLGLALAAIAPWALSERGRHHASEILVASPVDFLKGYAKHFTPRTLVSGHVDQGFMPRGVPPLLAFELPFLALGLARVLREPSQGSLARGRFLGVWLLAWPLAAALTTPAPNLLRAIFGLPLFAILGALGVERFLDELAKKRARARSLALAVLVALALASIGDAVERYRRVFPLERSAWSPYEGERERVARMHGTVELTLPNERALVDLYARERPHHFPDAHHVVLDER